MVAAGDMVNEAQLEHPSNALKLGFDVKRLLNLKIAVCIETEDPSAQQDAEDVIQSMNNFWGTRAAKLANVIFEERRLNQVKTLPMPEDVRSLNTHLNTSILHVDLKKIPVRISNSYLS